MTQGTAFQWRLRDILEGTDQLTTQEIETVRELTSSVPDLVERVDSAFEESINVMADTAFEFGV